MALRRAARHSTFCLTLVGCAGWLVSCSSDPAELPAAASAGGAAGAAAGSGATIGGTGGSAGAVGGLGGSLGGGGSGGQPAAEAGSGGEGGEAEPGPEQCGEGEWTCVPVPVSGPYGEKTIEVPAAQNWVNTGLFLKQGETATVKIVSGEWSLDDEGDDIDHGSCLIGDFVARIGLHYKDPELTCVDGEATVTADKDGILFLGALANNDLGDTYMARNTATGSKIVTVSSSGDTAPTVLASEAATFSFGDVTSGWVELWGEHVILTLPVATAVADAPVLEAALERLDTIYELEEELRGDVPMLGQRIRFFPDATTVGYMLAGNPIRMLPSLVTDESTRISRAAEPGVGNWGFAHELGHIFSWTNGFWTYEENTIEVWTNVFTLYAFEDLGLEPIEDIAFCDADSTLSYESGSWGPWEGLCFLMQFQYDYGWDMYKDFFRSLNGKSDSDMTNGAWWFVHDELEAASGGDVTPTFEAWGVPHP